jgi:ketosteroid isomerase-like protein
MGTTETLIEFEERMWRANREGDGTFYADHLRDDALVVSRYGVMGKAEIVPGIQANQNPYLRTELSDHRVIQIDDSSALVTYHVAITALIDGTETELTAYATSVYVRDGDQWRGVFHQQTAL